jgi:alpha-D-ribose 1-methylphosphonate 5-triphosphate diphosphatase PhnM
MSLCGGFQPYSTDIRNAENEAHKNAQKYCCIEICGGENAVRGFSPSATVSAGHALFDGAIDVS